MAYSNLTWRSAQTNATEGNAARSFAGLTIGAAASDRWVILATAHKAGNGLDSNPTIDYGSGALSMTTVVAVDASNPFTAIFALNAPTGTTATFSVDPAGGGSSHVHIGYWTVNMNSGLATDTAKVSGAAPTENVNIDIPENGFAIGVAIEAGTTDRAHSVNASFIEQDETFTASGFNAAFNLREVTTAAPGVTVTDTFTSGTSVMCMSYASFDGGVPAGQPTAKRMGGVKFVGNIAGQNTSLWRKAGELLLPQRPSIIRV